MATLISTAVTVRASKKADKIAPAKQNNSDNTIFDRILMRIFVNVNKRRSLMK